MWVSLMPMIPAVFAAVFAAVFPAFLAPFYFFHELGTLFRNQHCMGLCKSLDYYGDSFVNDEPAGPERSTDSSLGASAVSLLSWASTSL